MTTQDQPPVIPGSPYQPQNYAPVPPSAFYQRPPRKRWVVPVIVALSVALAAAIGAVTWLLLQPAAAAGGTFVVTGDLTLDSGDRGVQPIDSGCQGSGGFSDIAQGTAVTVSDSTGATIALGRLDHGRNDGSLGRAMCSFTFTVAGVPAGKGFYGVEVSHRGRVQYTEAELSRPLKLTLG